MPSIDLRAYVVAKWGDWSTRRDAFTPSLLRLDGPDDGLTLTGPLRVRVAVQARNEFNLLGTSQVAVQARDAFSYVLDLPPGQTWTYPAPRLRAVPWQIMPIDDRIRTISQPLMGSSSQAATASGGSIEMSSVGTAWPFAPDSEATISGGTSHFHDATPLPGGTAATTVHGAVPIQGSGTATPPPGVASVPSARDVVLGTNGGYAILIRPAGHETCGDPCAELVPDPCAPKRGDCGCGCGGSKGGGGYDCGCGGHDDIPCDYAVVSRPNAGRFFPSACEPCAPGAMVAVPALRGPSLVVPPAAGGTVRTRFFTGMFITKEDLETEQRNIRLKRSLMNRAMGQGVVWGLGVGLDGDALCVRPGYGVDCCGNDLVLGATYRVDADALLRDPAASSLLATSGTQRAHLVLEYFECPEQPRPVHGDVCAPEATRCETSRIRETVRLRLAPPCEVDKSGPIADFLEEIEALRSDPQVAALFQPEAPPAGTTTQPATVVPFDVEVRVDYAEQRPVPGIVTGVVTIDPPAAPPPAQGATGLGNMGQDTAQVTVTLQAKPGFRFTGGTVQQSRDLDTTVRPFVSVPVSRTISAQRTETQIRWALKLPRVSTMQLPNAPAADPIPPGLEFALSNWTMSEAGGGEWKGTTFIALTPLTVKQWQTTPAGHTIIDGGGAEVERIRASEGVLHVLVPPGQPTVTRGEGRIPCMTECCDDDGPSRFGVSPIFMHENPMKPGEAADPKVILLAIIYAWLKVMSARNAAAGAAASAAQMQVAGAVYRAAWQATFGIQPQTARFDLTAALQRLLEAWCRGFLYSGPRCRCEPHGVVIGCVCIEGGTIHSVDPWGGRRWVMHYPLLAHWGQQLGIMPIDAIASKLFGLVCCIAGLPQPDIRGERVVIRGAAVRGVAAGAEAGRPVSAIPREAPVVDLGNAVLVHGSRDALSVHLATLGLTTQRQEMLDPMAFLGRVNDAVLRAPEGALSDHPLVDYTVIGAPDVHFVAPAPAGVRDRVGAPATQPVGTGGTLRETVRAGVAGRPARSAVPALLRGFTESLTTELAGAMPLTPAADPERPVVDRLGGAGVRTVADALNTDLEALHAEVLRRENAAELTAIVDRSESTIRALTRAVGDAVLDIATQRGLSARGGFATPEAREQLAREVEERLRVAKLPVPAEDKIHEAVSRAAGPSVSGGG